MKKKIGLITGNFNFIHLGHKRFFKNSKNYCEKLVVAINTKNKSKKNYKDIKREIEALEYVDLVIENKDLKKTIDTIKPNYIFKGYEWKKKKNPESKYKNKFKFNIIFDSGNFEPKKAGTYDLKVFKESQIRKFILTHQISINKIQEILKNFNKLKVLVIGDLIIDEYINCSPVGMSREETVLAIKKENSSYFLGGAAIVAAHIASMGCKVKFISVSGKDKELYLAKNKLKQYKVPNKIFSEKNRKTTLKQRIRTEKITHLKVSQYSSFSISKNTEEVIFKEVSKFKKIDLIIFSDFNYGCLSSSLVKKIIKFAKKNKILTAADSQSSSQLGSLGKFHGVNFITPTEYEARLTFGDMEDNILSVGKKLLKKFKSKYLFLKLGSEGLLVFIKEKKNRIYYDRIPAINTKPVDVAGAGDSLISASAITLSIFNNPWYAGYIGSLMASLQISKVGNTPCQLPEFKKILLDNFYK